MERLNECLGILGDRFLVRGVALGLLAHPGTSDNTRHQGEQKQN
jgi:hypothetical protein